MKLVGKRDIFVSSRGLSAASAVPTLFLMPSQFAFGESLDIRQLDADDIASTLVHNSSAEELEEQ